MPASDPAEAKRLFFEAKRLQKEGQVAEACALLDRSLALDHASGTVLQLAYCLELQGKLASSHARFADALALALQEGNTRRAELAQKHLDALEPRLQKLEIRVGATARAQEGLEVRRDGVCVEPGSWNKPVPVDPGRHRITAAAVRSQPWEMTVEPAPEGATISIEVPALSLRVVDASIPVDPGGAVARPRSGLWSAGVAVTAVGAAGLVMGAVTGGMAISTARGVVETCKDQQCPPSLKAQGDRARALGTASTFGLAMGAALVASGVMLIVARPAGRSTVTVSVTGSIGALWAVGSF